MKVEIDIPTRRIADLMVTAIEGNDMTRSWCAHIHLKGAMEGRERDLVTSRHVVWYDNPKAYEGDFAIEIAEIIDESQPMVADNLNLHLCGPAQFQRGLQLMAEKQPSHFSDFMEENEDAITADVFLQLVALGDVVYG